MAVQTFRHAARLSPSGHHLLDRLRAPLCNAALEERIHAWRMSEWRISLYDEFASLTVLPKQDPECQEMSVLVARSALLRLERAMQGFFSRVKSGREPGFPRRPGADTARSVSMIRMIRKGKDKRGLNRAIAEQGWGEFFDILKCKAASAGIPFVEVPPAGTSQDCSRCGNRVP